MSGLPPGIGHVFTTLRFAKEMTDTDPPVRFET
jgi:hypothetical protein